MQKKQTTSQESFEVDQTSFSAEEPLYENASLPQEPSVELPTDSATPLFKTKAFKIGAVVSAIFVLLLVILLGVMMNRGQQQQIVEPSPTPSMIPVSNDPIKLRINELSKNLLDSDPADDALPLPPIDLEISLEE